MYKKQVVEMENRQYEHNFLKICLSVEVQAPWLFTLAAIPGEPGTLNSAAAPLSVGVWFASNRTNLFELTWEGNEKL